MSSIESQNFPMIPGDIPSGSSKDFLGESEVLNNRLTEMLPIPVYTCDTTGLITSYNEAAAILWGRSPVPGKEYWCGAWRAFASDGTALNANNSALSLLLQGKSVPAEEEITIERPDGSLRYITGHPRLLKDDRGRITGAVNILMDITEKKLSVKNSALLTAIFQSSDDAIISKTLEGIITTWNPGAERLFGYKAEEMIGQSIMRLIPDDRLDEEPKIIEKLKKGEHVEHFDTLRRHKDGHLIDISLSISPVKDHLGRIVGASKIARDITTQKLLYNVLHQSEKKFREMVEQAPVGIIILKGENMMIEVINEAYKQILGISDAEVLQKSIFDILPDSRNSIGDILLNVMEKGEPYSSLEFKLEVLRQGIKKPAYFNFVYQPLRDAFGKIEGVIAIANEVTEQVEAKHAQLETEREFRRIVMSSPVAMAVFRGKDYVIELANPVMFRDFWKLEEHQVMGKKLLDAFPELNQQKYPELLAQVLIDGIPHSEKEAVAYIQQQDELKKFILDYEYGPLYEPDGSISGILITVNDVTERVEARQWVEDAEARLRLAAEGTGLATWDLDLVTQKLIYSPRLVEIFGYAASDKISREQLNTHFHPGDRAEIVDKAFAQALETGICLYEARIIATDQSTRWIHTRGRVIYDEDRKPVRMLGTMADVTEQKLASKALEESEQRLNIALTAAELGTWELDVKTENVSYSDRYLQIMGFNENLKPSLSELLLTIHPDDRLQRDEALKNAQVSGTMDIEMRIITPSKEIRWIKAKGKMIYSHKGEAERMLGTVMDITEQKAAFVALQESEERFKTVADGAPVMIWMSGSDKFMDFFNSTWLNFTGKTLEEESKDGWLSGVHPADKERCLKIYTQSFEKKAPFQIEYRLKRYDGVYRWISDNAVPRYTPDGNFVGFISACMDIDDEKRVNQQLVESQLLFQTISNVSPVGLWMTNEKGENNFVNGTWIDWTGIPLFDQFGQGWLAPLLEEDRELCYEAYMRQAAKREKFSAEFRFKRADGSIRWALSEGFPYFDGEGNFAGYAGSVSDITDRKQNELLKNEFLAVASHELKTPITSIKAYAQLLSQTYRKSNDTFLKNALNKIDIQVNKMNKLVADFLNLSKIESDKFQLTREVFSFKELIAEVKSDVELVSPGYIFTASFAPDPVFINADREKIMQVLTNLLTNAVKYSPDEKIVDIILESTPNEVTLKVKDRGVGIKPEEHELIFERFYRANTNNIHVSGFGIGLYISAEIVKKHGGSIGVKRNEDKGSCFYFTLPVTDL